MDIQLNYEVYNDAKEKLEAFFRENLIQKGETAARKQIIEDIAKAVKIARRKLWDNVGQNPSNSDMVKREWREDIARFFAEQVYYELEHSLVLNAIGRVAENITTKEE